MPRDRAPVDPVLIDTADLDGVAGRLPPTALGWALRRAARERHRPDTDGGGYQRALE